MVAMFGSGVLAVLWLGLAGSMAAQDPVVPTPDEGGDYRFRWTEPDGTAREFVLVPAGKIKPRASVDISPYYDGRYLYSYRLGNGADAKQRLYSCQMEVRLPTSIEFTPYGWEGLRPLSVAPRLSWYMTRSGTIDGGKDGIPPGSEATGFQLSSENLPGVSEFVCLSNQELTPVDENILPEWLLKQLELIPPSVVDEARVHAIGPFIVVRDQGAGDLARAVAALYGEAFASSKHPRGSAVRMELGLASRTAQQADASQLVAALMRLQQLLAEPVEDSWARELTKGLNVCISHLLAKLQPA